MLALAVGLCGCQSAGRAPRPAASALHSEGDAMSADQAGNMAAEDADALRLPQAKRQPSRRPPELERRRAVDQPRIRP